MSPTESQMPSNSPSCTPEENFGYTGGEQSYEVPDGVEVINVRVCGAEGKSRSGSNGGDGAEAIGTLSVSGGETLYIYVGGQPGGRGGGFNGGGDGGSTSGPSRSEGGGGGGASDIRQGKYIYNSNIC